MSENNRVSINIELPEESAYQLAQFCKRSGFSTFYDLTEAHLPDEERKQKAYLMIAGIEAVQSALAEAGYSPR